MKKHAELEIQGHKVLIDRSKLKAVKSLKLSVLKSGGRWIVKYLDKGPARSKRTLANLLLGLEKGRIVYFKNGNSLDLRSSNMVRISNRVLEYTRDYVAFEVLAWGGGVRTAYLDRED